MNNMSVSVASVSSIASAYEADGFLFPCDVVSEKEAGQLLSDLEAAEAELADDKERLSMLRGYSARLLPSFDRLIRHPRLIELVSHLLGPNLLVLGSGLFIKEPNSPSYVSWHQDLNYWGLDGEEEVTAWLALTPATVANGCMRFVPGSHKHKNVPHTDSFAADNLLTRGQEIAVKVEESAAVDVVLKAGQASFHHGHIFHASGPNGTNGRRIGVAIRYLATSMKQVNGEKLIISHVSGNDEYGHYNIAPPPAGRLLEEDFDRIRFNISAKRGILYRGVHSGKIKKSPKA